jgi:hypothetical protein
MIEYFTGRYLIGAGLMKKEQYNELIAWLRVAASDSTKLGGDNRLRDNQIAVINLLQNTIDEKLGDLVTEYSGLAQEPMFGMTKKQHVLNTAFFNQLIISGIVTADSLPGVLEKFRGYYGLNLPGISRNLKEDFDSILSTFIHAEDYYANEYAKIALKYILRFVGTRLSFGDSKRVFSFSAERFAVQKVVTTDNRYFLAIGGDKQMMQSFNDGIQSSFNDYTSKSRYSALMPFMNCITNIFQCLMAKERTILYTDSVSIYKYSTIFANDYCSVLSLDVEDIMKLSLVIGCGKRPNFATIAHNI